MRRTRPGDVDRLGERAPQLQVLAAGPRCPVEDDEVRRQARAFAVARQRSAGSCRKRLGVGGKKVAREREPTGEKLVADLLGRDAEAEDDALARGIALAPVVGVALELQPPPRLEADDAERPRADGALAPARADRAACPRERSPSRRKEIDRPGRRRPASRGPRRTPSARRCETRRDRSPRPSSRRLAPWIGREQPPAARSRRSGGAARRSGARRARSAAGRRGSARPARSRNRKRRPPSSIERPRRRATERSAFPRAAQVSVSKMLGRTSACSTVVGERRVEAPHDARRSGRAGLLRRSAGRRRSGVGAVALPSSA